MKTIGAYYENSLDQVNQPGKGPGGSDGYYIPGPTGSMDCATLQTYKDQLENQINYWYGILQSPGNNNRELENLNKIINVQKSKKDLYTEYMLRTCTVNPETTPVPDVLPTDQPTYDPGTADPLPTDTTIDEKKTNWLLIAGVGVGALLLLRKKKRGGGKSKKVSGVKGEDLLLIGIGGFLVYKLASKNSGTSSTPSTSAARKQQLISWMNGGPDTAASKAEFEQILNTMSAHEIDVTYNWVFYRISAADTQAIFDKYEIFT